MIQVVRCAQWESAWMLVPSPLVEHVRGRRCVLFVGSGLSAQANLPTWRALIDAMVEVASDEQGQEAREEIHGLLEKRKLAEVAAHCRDTLGERLYSEVLARHLRGDEVALPRAHDLIARTPYAGIVTTNYDMLLERAYRERGQNPKLPTHADTAMLGPLLFSGDFFILKAHGDIDRPSTIVLTAEDYRSIVHSNDAFRALFSALLLTKALLFVGYSLEDPDFRLLLEHSLTLFGEHAPERYALMTGVGPIERGLLRRNAGIRVISYANDAGDHAEVVDFLAELQQQAAPALPEGATEEENSDRKPVTLIGVRQTDSGARMRLRLTDEGLEVDLVTPKSGAVAGRSGRPLWSKPGSILEGLVRSDLAGAASAVVTSWIPEGMIRVLERSLDPGEPLTIELAPEVQRVPWEWITVDGMPVCLRNPVSRAPVGVSERARGIPRIHSPLRVLLAGPDYPGGAHLEGAKHEIGVIGELYAASGGADVELAQGSEVTFARLAELLRKESFDVIHIVGHSGADETETFLLLADQAQLRPSETRWLLSGQPPAVLFLNTEFSAFVLPASRISRSSVRANGKPGDTVLPQPGPLGFSGAAAAVGVGSFVGSFAHLNDGAAAQVGIEFHRGLLAGQTVGEAMWRARQTVSSVDPDDWTWAAYVVTGPDIVIRATSGVDRPT